MSVMISASGFSACQMVFESSQADLFGWEDKDEDLMFAQDTFVAGQFARQWKLRMRAQEAPLKGSANGYLRRVIAYNKSFSCTGVSVGGSVLFRKAQSR